MRKKSKYKPKPVRLNVMGWLMEGFDPLTAHKDALLNLRIRNHAALASIVRGAGSKDDVNELVAAVNMTEALAMGDIGNDWRKEIHEGQEAVLTMARRGLERGKFLFTGPELTAVNLVMEVHDAQLETCTVAELDKAIALVQKTIRNGKARQIDLNKGVTA